MPPNVVPKTGFTNQLKAGLNARPAEHMDIKKKPTTGTNLLPPVTSERMGMRSTAGTSTKEITEVAVAAEAASHPSSIR